VRINVGPEPAGAGIESILARLDRWHGVGGLAALDAFMGRIEAFAADPACSLDLIGHSIRAQGGLLQLGTMAIDAARHDVYEVFARQAPTLRGRVTAIRLLGCGTAASERGRDTIARLRRATGVRVLGTIGPVCDVFFDAQGFMGEYDNRLVDETWQPPRHAQARGVGSASWSRR
jgi:hypothetical protein